MTLSHKTVALFGGSFNPIHIGHIQTAEYLQSVFHYDYFIFMPVSIPVHKDSSAIIDGRHRLQMCRLAAAVIPNAIVSDMEIKRGGSSYTVDTVHELLRYGDNETVIDVVIGDDLLPGLPKWKEIDALCSLAHFVCLTRESVRPQLPYPITYIDNPIIEVSSSQIRDRIKNGESIDGLVPSSVAGYIAENNLYAK